MYRNVMLFSVIMIMLLLAGCVNQNLSNGDVEYLSNNENNNSTGGEMIFSSDVRETPEWRQINDNVECCV